MATTTVITTQPVAQTISSTRYATERDWHNGLFGCFSHCSSCKSSQSVSFILFLILFFTSPVTFVILIVVDMMIGKITILKGIFAYFCPVCYMSYVSTRLEENCCLPCCVPWYIVPLRTKIRTENRIRGSICNDCLVGTFCHFCAITQIHRENIYSKKGKVLT